MKTNTFHRLLDNVKQLNTLQYRELKELIENIDSINHVSRDLETPYDDLKCPYCECKEKLRWVKEMIYKDIDAKPANAHTIL